MALLILLTIHIAAAIAAPRLVKSMGRNAFLLLSLVPASAALWITLQTFQLSGTSSYLLTEQFTWVPQLQMNLDSRLDPLSVLMGLVVTVVGTLVLIYSSRYFENSDADLGRFAGVLMAFAGAMLGLVFADNVLYLYVMWELTTVFSYLLIGHDSARKFKRRAALQALLVTTLGGLSLLVGLIILGESAGSYLLTDIVGAGIGSGTAVTVAVALVALGAVSKSALVPVHFWLPSAMAAPTPVSAFLHAAAMVKAGVFLVAILTPAMAGIVTWSVPLVVLGLLTLLVGGWNAVRQHDLKLLLAYGTISQLGMLVALLATGTKVAALAGVALLLSHAMFKATLFLVVGIIDHAAGTRDLRRISGLARKMPVLFFATCAAAASMAGLPPTLGFIAKEAALEAYFGGSTLEWLALVALLVGSAFTVAYSARFVWGAFATKADVRISEIDKPGWLLQLSPVLLASGGLVGALAIASIDSGLTLYSGIYPGESDYHLSLWHGLNPVLGLSALVIAAGLLLFRYSKRLTEFQERLHVGPSAHSMYVAVMRSLDRTAVLVTTVTQRGSLSFYVATIASVLSVLALVGAVAAPWPTQWRLWDNPLQAVPVIIAIAAAIMATRVVRRMAAVLLVGVAGYAVAAIFAMHGAPDLALTQLLVETITLVVFVLVMRKLPAAIADKHNRRQRAQRLVISLVFGSVMAVVAAIASGARIAAPISDLFPQQAYDFGGGKNVVNVTLVDIRAWDTIGEISVLVVAATGVASLIFLRRRGRIAEAPVEEVRDTSDDGRGVDWLRWSRYMKPEQRSIVLEIVSRLVFHTVLVLSVYLLFAGHNAPGGGFAGGLVAGLALVVRYLAGGRHELGEAAPVDAGLFLGLGLLLATATGAAGLVLGYDVLQTAILEASVPVLGNVKLVTSLFFDIGVYLIVIGLILDVLRSLGAELDRREGSA